MVTNVALVSSTTSLSSVWAVARSAPGTSVQGLPKCYRCESDGPVDVKHVVACGTKRGDV